jgi:hypothetical protein
VTIRAAVRPPALVAVETDPRRGSYVGGAVTADPSHAGRVYAVVPKIVEPSRNGEPFHGSVVFSSSTDGGRTRRPAAQIYDPGENRLTTGHQIVVLPGGALADVFTLVDLSAGPTATSVAVMRSTDPVSGRLHVVWQDARFTGGQADSIALSSSDDGGRTWSAPIRVNATPTGIPYGTRPVRTVRTARRRRSRPRLRHAHRPWTAPMPPESFTSLVRAGGAGRGEPHTTIVSMSARTWGTKMGRRRVRDIVVTSTTQSQPRSLARDHSGQPASRQDAAPDSVDAPEHA